MATVHAAISLNASPSLSGILGSTGSQAIVNDLNMSMTGGTGVLFSQAANPIQNMYQNFMTNVVQPIQRTTQTIMDTCVNVLNNDKIVPITSTSQLHYVPEAMHIPILTYGPVRDLLKDERIYGWGYKEEDLPEEDDWGRWIDNGRWICDDPRLPEEEQNIVTHEWRYFDPEVKEEEIEAVEKTRLWMDEFLWDQNYDPTDYPNKRDMKGDRSRILGK